MGSQFGEEMTSWHIEPSSRDSNSLVVAYSICAFFIWSTFSLVCPMATMREINNNAQPEDGVRSGQY